jgi:hypothetical protein
VTTAIVQAARRRGDPRHRGDRASVELDQRLAALGRECRVVAAPACRGVRPAGVDLGIRPALEDAEAALAKSRVGRHRHADDVGERRRGRRSAHEIARDDRFDAFVGERRRGPPRLPLAARTEQRVELALHPHLGVPDRFAVADRDDPRDVGACGFAVAGHARQRPDRFIAAAGSACTSRSASPRRGRGRRSRGAARRR